MTLEVLQLTDRARGRLPLVIVAGAMILTAVLMFAVLPQMETKFRGKYTVGFADGYDLIANNLIDGNGYRSQAGMAETMIREPGYPLFLAAIFKLLGHDIETVRSVNLLLTIGIAFMIIRLTRTVTPDRSTALIATLLFLFHPGTLVAEARAGVEVLFIFVACVFMVALHHAMEKGNLWRYFVAGLSLGAVVQVRSTPLLFPLFFLFYTGLIAYDTRARLKALGNVAILVLGMVVVMAPWLIRNYRLVHEFVPTATIQGLNLHEGQYACQNLPLDGDFYAVESEAGSIRGELARTLGLHFEGAQYRQEFYNAHDEWAFYNRLSRTAEEQYVKHPELLAACVGRNLYNFWVLGKTWKVTKLNLLIQIPLLVLICAGLYLLQKRGLLHKMGLMLTFAVSILAVHLPIVAEARHCIPLLAFLVIPASVSMMAIWHSFRTTLLRGCR
jgi:4-amino-4-deoxy-L-arabinose transferase-like glycosyltransferase